MNETLGQRIRRLRKERNLSQTELGNLVGVTISWISTIEQDRSTPSAELLAKLADTFKIPIRELLQNEDQHMELVSRIKLVEVLLETSKSKEAEQVINNVLKHPELSTNQHDILTVYLAESKYQQKQPNESLEILLPLIHTLEVNNHHDAYLLAQVRNQIGKAYTILRQYTNAFYNYQKAYDYSNRFEFNVLSAKICYNLGVALMIKGRYEDSISHLQSSFDFFERVGDLKSLGQVYYEQGLAYKNMKEYSKAIDCFEHAKVILNSHNLKIFSAIVQHTIASVLTLEKNPDQAIQELTSCLPIFEEENDYPRMILIHTKIANAHLQKRDFNRAALSLNDALNLVNKYQVEKNHPSTGELYKYFGQYYYETGNYSKSIYYASKSFEIFDRIGFIRDQIQAMKISTDAYQRLGQFDKAFVLERQRCELFEKLQLDGVKSHEKID
ncbi:tetratricopeptide repeat protein [Tumebacillus avium]|nr:tetratricopeptide repeat protein [Tumebacillus avium]